MVADRGKLFEKFLKKFTTSLLCCRVEVQKPLKTFDGHRMRNFPRQAQSEKCTATVKSDCINSSPPNLD